MLAGAVACGDADPRGVTESAVTGAEYSELFAWDSLEELRQADAVVVATVVGEREKPNPETQAIPGEPREFLRDLELRVERTFRGRPVEGDSFVIRDLGWYVFDDGRRAPITGHDGTRLEVGHRALVALIGNGTEPNTSALFTRDAALFLENREVVDTGRTKKIIRELESLSEAQLVARVEQAMQ